LAVLANRFDAIVREMSNTMLRTARSAVIATARDFSCSLATAGNELLAVADGLPVHAFSSHFQTRTLSDLHPNLREGDAYLHNDPYLGNTHSADMTILVPVFVDGEHMFTAVAKAHQADIGNAAPSTYMPNARDVYEEGALVFPAVQVQRNERDIDDIIRMCRARIRVPEQWYGDYLAMIGAARIGERKLHELANRYGRDTLQAFIGQWFDYSERRMEQALKALPSGTAVGRAWHDPLPALPEGVEVKARVEVDATQGRAVIDLTDNVDCLPAGINLSEATATNGALTGLYNVLPPDIPRNSGAFRRVQVLLRENCAVGIPRFPASCSMSTTNLANRVVSATQMALVDLGIAGMAETGSAMCPGVGVISGRNQARGGAPFVNQIIITSNGGGASAQADGWLTVGHAGCGGLVYRDSIEIDEQKYPVVFDLLEVAQDGGGPGRFRGAPPLRIQYGPSQGAVTVAVMSDCALHPAQGAAGGSPGVPASVELVDQSGERRPLPPVGVFELTAGQRIAGVDAGGGGYGDPFDRPVAAVLHDVREGWVSVAAAQRDYGVVVVSDSAHGLVVDQAATAAWRGR
jgi:N-methylhydantoinase B